MGAGGCIPAKGTAQLEIKRDAVIDSSYRMKAVMSLQSEAMIFEPQDGFGFCSAFWLTNPKVIPVHRGKNGSRNLG
ncbi:MAG: hypothetical protein DDG59_05515 [Anaerolineae bacterium]|nr:MAG: hypothetical protein DDG59_05515 [Anaerolineae bacterium]